MLPTHNSSFSVGAKKIFLGMECKNIEYFILFSGPPGCYDILTRSCISYNAEKCHSPVSTLPSTPIPSDYSSGSFPRGCVSAQLSYLWEATRHLVDPTCHLDFQPPGGNWPSPCYSSDHLRHQSLKL